MYTEQDYRDLCAQVNRRWAALLAASALLLAGVVISFVFRQKYLTMALTAVLGCLFVFCYGLFLAPVIAYRRHLDEVLHGRVRSTTGVFKEMEEQSVIREGVRYYPLLINVGRMEEPEDDRLFYYDARLPRPDWRVGEWLTVTAHDKTMGAWERLNEEKKA